MTRTGVAVPSQTSRSLAGRTWICEVNGQVMGAVDDGTAKCLLFAGRTIRTRTVQ